MPTRTRVNYPGEDSAQLLRQLREAVKPAGLFGRKQDPAPFLAALAELGEPGVLRDLIGITMEADLKWQSQCAHVASTIAEALLPNRLADWDEWVRRSWSVLLHSDDPWRKLKPRMVEEFPAGTPDEVIVLGLCASHQDGFVREAAVRRLAQSTKRSELGFLILRANDWVPAVQMRAQTAIMDRLKASYSSTFVEHLPLLDYLVRATRSDHQPLLTSIEKFLRSEEGLSAVLVNLDSPDYRLRRRCFDLGYGAYGKQPEWLSEKALADSDVVIRYRAYTRLFADEGPAPSTLLRAAQDSFARIRRLAFEICVAGDAATNAQVIRAFLFDRSGELRRDSQRRWRSLKLGDPADVYRVSLQTDWVSMKPQAVAGLGETGIVGDSELVKGFLKHHHSRVRRMAIRSLCRLQPPQFLETVMYTLFEDTPAVAAAAEACLAKHVREVAAGSLWDRAVNSGTVDRQVRVLRVFRQLSKWDRLECLLRSVLTAHDIHEFALSELDDWTNHFNTSFTTPTSEQHSTLAGLLSQVKMLIPPPRIAGIEFVLRRE